MKAIIIGAGRGRRLTPLTKEVPKCYAAIGGRRILDWTLGALRSAGLDMSSSSAATSSSVRADYPQFHFLYNAEWRRTTFSRRLIHAEAEMTDGFVSSYADILYTPEAVQHRVASPADIALLVDTDWRGRYRPRTQHPSPTARRSASTASECEVDRAIPPAEAPAEFTGVAKFSPLGARLLTEHYHRARGPRRRAVHGGARSRRRT